DNLSDAEASMQWFPVTCETTSLTIERGGQVDGPSTSIDVGTMALRYLDGPDPATDPRVRPGVRCRVSAPVPAGEEFSDSWGFESGDGSPTFTGAADGPGAVGWGGSVSATVDAAAARTGSNGLLVEATGDPF